MKDEQLKQPLEELFSDLSPPAPEGEAEPPPPPSQPVEEAPLEPKAKPPAPPEAGAPEDIRTWQRQLVRGVLRVLTIVGALALVAGSYNAYTEGEAGLIPYYVGAYVVLTLITFWRRVSYGVQAGTLLGLIYGLGVLGLFEAGLSGDGRVFLLTLPILAAVFFGRGGGILTLAVTMLTLVAFAWAFSTGHIVIPVAQQANSADPTAWLSGSIVFFMLGTLLLTSQNYLIPRLAAALTRSRGLAQELAAHRARLEEQVAERTRELQEANWQLQRRALQLEASAEVGRAAASILDIDELLNRTVDLIRDRFGFYHAGVFLLDEAGEWAELRAATGEAGRKMLAQGHRLAVGETSMVGWTAAHRQPRIALDVGKDAIHFDNPLLPHTRSEMTLPLMVGERLLGVLDVQSTEEAAFDEDDVRTLRTVADQIAVAIENARRFSDEALLLEATSPIYRASRRLTTATTSSEVADAIMDSVAETGADGCVVVEFEYSPAGEPEALLYLGVWRRDREPQFQAGMRVPIAESPFPFEMVSTLWTVADVEQDEQLPQSARRIFETTEARALANIPLRTGGRVAGQVVVLRTTPGPFSDAALRLYEMLSDQAAVALERARLLEEAQRRATVLSTLYEIGRRISAALELDTTLNAIVESTAQLVQADRSIILLVDTEEKRLIKAVGYGYPPEPMAGFTYQQVEDGISGWVLREGTPTISENILTDPRNTGIALEVARKEGEGKSIVVAPLLVKGRAIGTLTAVRNVERPVFTTDELRLVTMFADQAAIAIENARLFEEMQRRAAQEHTIRDVVEKITGGFDVQTILQTTVKELSRVLGASDAYVELAPLSETMGASARPLEEGM